MEFEIERECEELQRFLVTKNRAYGNSAFEGLGVFSRLAPTAALDVRIDDKLRRIRNATAQGSEDTEDSELDLIGYLILKRIARRFEAEREETRE